MKYKLTIQIDINADSDNQASEFALETARHLDETFNDNGSLKNITFKADKVTK